MENFKIIENEDEFVDLGLSVKWATCNVGATKPEEYGLYFAWGETEGYQVSKNEDGSLKILDANGNEQTSKTAFYWNDYKYCNGSDTSLTKYCYNYGADGFTDTLTTLESSDDAAYQTDNTCRMPTAAELQELIDNTTSEWETLNGVNGVRFTSNINGNSIFVPAAGYYYYGSPNRVGSSCYLWSSSLSENFSMVGWCLKFHSDCVNVDDCILRCNGSSVRAVQDK